MPLKLFPLYELRNVRDYPQYSIEPFRYYATPISYSTYYRPSSTEVVAYLLCFKGKCIGLHFIDDNDDNLVIDAESTDDIEYVIENLLKSPELSEHEIEALARFFYVDRETIEEMMYMNWLKSKVNGKRVAIIRNIAYILYDGIHVLGETNPRVIRKLGGNIVESPVSEMVSYISRRANPDFYSLGRGGVLFCNSEEKKCVCFPVEEIIDVLTRKMSLKMKIAERWMKRGRYWLVWFGGEKYVSTCPPRREGEGKEGGEETVYLEYITR